MCTTEWVEVLTGGGMAEDIGDEIGAWAEYESDSAVDALAGDTSGLEDIGSRIGQSTDPLMGAAGLYGWAEDDANSDGSISTDPTGGDNAGDGDDPDDPDDDDSILELLLGRLASGWRTKGSGRGIGANILSGGSGISNSPRTIKRSLLG